MLKSRKRDGGCHRRGGASEVYRQLARAQSPHLQQIGQGLVQGFVRSAKAVGIGGHHPVPLLGELDQVGLNVGFNLRPQCFGDEKAEMLRRQPVDGRHASRNVCIERNQQGFRLGRHGATIAFTAAERQGAALHAMRETIREAPRIAFASV